MLMTRTCSISCRTLQGEQHRVCSDLDHRLGCSVMQTLCKLAQKLGVPCDAVQLSLCFLVHISNYELNHCVVD